MIFKEGQRVRVRVNGLSGVCGHEGVISKVKPGTDEDLRIQVALDWHPRLSEDASRKWIMCPIELEAL